MSNIKKEIQYWSQIFLIPIYILSFIMPRNRKIWAFGSTFGRRFADNPRYFYLYLNQYQINKVRPIWISKDRDIVNRLTSQGYESYYYNSIRGIWFSLRAKIYIFDNYSKDINFWLSGGSIKINLWHGVPLKKIQNDNKFDEVRHPINRKMKMKYFLRRMSDEKPSHYVMTTSKNLVSIFETAFKTNNVIVSGYPRNDSLISDKIRNEFTQSETNSIQRMQSKQYSKIVLYMPTFRDTESKFFESVKIDELCQYLKKNNLLFCIKLHPKSKLLSVFLELENDNIHVINPEDDPYVYLKKADILMTDYSSIYFDYLLLDKPIIFFAYDLKEYLESSREFYFNYLEFTPGSKVCNWNELKNTLDRLLQKQSSEDERIERKTIRNFVFEYDGRLGSERLFYSICDIIDKGGKI